MTEMTSYEPGTPSWVDLGTPDIGASAAFYEALFGWSIPEGPNSEQTGGYRMAMQGDKPTAGMMPLMQEGQPPAWSTYVAVEDADATAAAVKGAGGTVLAEPMDVLDLGRMAVFADPSGAVFGVWQPGTFVGAGLVNEPVSVTWNELNTRDPDGSKEFYAAAFGWSGKDVEMGEGMTYTELHRAGDALIGGMLDMRGRVPDEVPPHWMVYFAVADCDATVESAKELGGELAFGPVEIPAGRFATLSDPQGAFFSVIALSPSAG